MTCESQHFIKNHFIIFGGFMSKNVVLDLSMNFAVEIVNLCDSMKGKSVLTNQLLRSGTSIGANIHEANYASSTADFISKLQIALKECYETEYWLKLFAKTNMINESIYTKLSGDSGKIRRLLIASINTTKGNLDK
jgi:four helix bundle protein